MDQKDYLSNNDIRCILVFLENIIIQCGNESSLSKRIWFENFREYLGFSQLRYSNSKKMNDISEERIFGRLKLLRPSVKSWLVECTSDMITSGSDLNIEDARITASHISAAFNVPLSIIYDVIKSQAATIQSNKGIENEQVEAEKTIYYSKYKTTGIFYNSGEYVFRLYPDDTISLLTADFTLHFYDLESLYEDRNDVVFIIRSRESGKIGEFRLKPLGKAEIAFSGKTNLKLKI